jgi:hypothetical protein
MIYETLLNCVDDLTTKWSGVQTAAQSLAAGLAASPAQQATVTGWANAAQGQSNALAAGRPALENFPPLAVLFASAQPLFANSETVLTFTINPQASVQLPLLVNSPDSQISSMSRDLQSRLADLTTLNAECLQEIIELQSNEGTRANIGGIRSSVDDISTYPVLTQDMSWGPIAPPSSGGGGGSTSSLGQIAAKALSEVLGRRPRLNDPKSFIAALNTSFTCKEVEGRTECTWTERVASGTTELGGSITGAQASIYLRAKEASDAAMPLLDGLGTLRVDADPQETEAMRSIVRTEFAEVVNEFGVEGGPRVQRVDDLLEALIGYVTPTAITVPPTPPTPRGDFSVSLQGRAGLISAPANADLLLAFGGGEVGRLGDLFGFTRNLVNTIQEEQNLTNYLVFRDYVRALYTSWLEFRASFLRGVENYLGTQLILLQRTLSVVAESVDETTFAMDSVFLGPAERQTVRIDFPVNVAPTPMYVDELLTWVQNFASAEGTRIVEDGGKIGVRSIVPTLQLLQNLVQNSVGRIRHPAARHPRVRRTLGELASQLSEAARLAGTIQ